MSTTRINRAPVDMPAGGGGDANNTDSNNSGDENNQNKGGENNSENNVDNFSNLWENEDNKETENNNTNNTNTANAEPANNAADAFKNHIDGLDLTAGIDMNKISEGIKEGNFEDLTSAFKTVAGNAYQNAIMDSTKIMDAKIEKAVSNAVSQAKGNYQADQATQQLHTALPFTKDAAIAPVATAVMTQLIGKGKSSEEAIMGVKAFFAQTSKLSAKDLDLQIAPAGTPNGGRRGNNVFPAVDTEDDTDWVGALTGN